MKVQFVIRSPQSHEQKYCRNMLMGFAKHGITQVNHSYGVASPGYDLYVTWAWKPKLQTGRWAQIERLCKQQQSKCLVMERAYIGDRMHWVSLGFNGLNNRANFNNKDITDLSRWNANFKQYMIKQPAKKGKTGNVLIAGQVRKDASLAYLQYAYRDYDAWVMHTVQKIREFGYNPIYRPHPEDPRLPDWREYNIAPVEIDTSSTLEQALHRVDSTVTYSSNAGVISILNGVPAICHDQGSMIWNCSPHCLHNKQDLLAYPDKSTLKKWQAQMSYTQWQPHEMSDGTAWDHLKSAI